MIDAKGAFVKSRDNFGKFDFIEKLMNELKNQSITEEC